MRIITEPKVHLLARTIFIETPPGRDLPGDSMNDAVRLGAFAAKGCYDSFGVDGRSCIENQQEVLEHAHGSVLEHYNVTFWIEGISRALSHEMVRHRPGWAYSQRSTRYTKEEDAAIVLEPYLADLYKSRQEKPGGLTKHEVKILQDHIDASGYSLDWYKEQVTDLTVQNPLGLEGFALRKWARGKARNLLPHNLETRMTVTGNLRAWRHFIEMRSNRAAEAEIRRLVAHIFPHLFTLAPVYFLDYSISYYDDIIEYTTSKRKV